jgi:hypothetical protein
LRNFLRSGGKKLRSWLQALWHMAYSEKSGLFTETTAQLLAQLTKESNRRKECTFILKAKACAIPWELANTRWLTRTL